MLIGMLLATSIARTAAAQEDPWFGRDKALHFGVSFALGAGGYALAVPLVDERWQRGAIGAGVSLTAGAGKELYDSTGAGNASWKDFTWDIAGTIVGVGIAWLIDELLTDRRPECSTSAAGSTTGRGPHPPWATYRSHWPQGAYSRARSD